MQERELQSVLLEILRSAVNCVETSSAVVERISSENILPLYRLAKKHDLAHVVSKFAEQNQIQTDRETKTLLQREELLSIYRHEQMKYAYEEICSAFDADGIAYLPLKGAVLRPYYPYESMRTSCDIDILVHEGDLDLAIASLKKKGYSCGKDHYHDVSLYAPSKVHLELHYSVKENMEKLDRILQDAWQYAVPAGQFRFEFTKEFFVFHFFSHMAYHFVAGGSGLRSLLDLWVMEHRMGIPFACASELLEKAGIARFAEQMSELANRCFTYADRDVIDDPLLRYIFQGGVYGSMPNRVAVDKTKTGSAAVYALKRLFLPYPIMTIRYPVLKKAPYLLPVFWVVRGISALFRRKRRRIAAEMLLVDHLPEEKAKEVRGILARLGFDL